MHGRRFLVLGCVLSCAALPALAQETEMDRSFTTTSTDCKGVQWSQQMLDRYPDIGEACQAVEERDGKKYVKFQGTVESNAHGDLDVVFKQGSKIKLHPPQNMSVYMDGRRVPVANLERGDQLTFYVPEDRLTAQFFANEQPAPAGASTSVPLAAEQPAPRQEPERTAALPSTAGDLPTLALAGMLMLGLGAGLTIVRLRGR